MFENLFTFFKNIFQVKSSNLILIDSNLNIESKKFWNITDKFNLEKEYDETKILNKFRNEIEKSIEYRQVADVEVGTYLSGGLDSSIITAYTSIMSNKTLNSYTIGFRDLNEFEYSDIVANKFKTCHHKILLKKEDYLKNWNELIRFKDSPLGVPNEIPLAIMSNKLKEKITVVLSGEGADELMGGYGRIFRSPFDFSNSKVENNFYDYFINLYDYVPRSIRKSLLIGENKFMSYFDNQILSESKSYSNEEFVFRYFHKYHIKGLLQRVDMTTMQTSVEARVPFLDHNLVDFSYSEIPYDLKLKWNSENSVNKAKNSNSNAYSELLDTPKYLLRQVGKKLLPENIVDRRKVGFPVPLSEWFGDLESLANDYLTNVNWLKKNSLNELIKRSKNHARSGQILWMFLNVEMFKKTYFNKDWRW